MNVRFIHIADCHLGSWRDEKLRQVSQDSFEYVISQALSRKVDFVIIAGDLFNTALPSIDILKFAVTQLQKLKDAQIPVYAIAGSHDYSASGKTMLEVLKKAALLK
ncbi:MAG: DNA repair exonuclease, partial [Candidatus Woesearchaeota archaeon]